MKKIHRSLLCIVLAMSLNNLNAQFRLGPVAGLNLARVKYSIEEDYSFIPLENKFKRIPAAALGAIFDYGFTDNVGIEGGVFASVKGGNVESDISVNSPFISFGGTIHGIQKIRLTYLEFPFLLRTGGVAGKMNIHFMTGFSVSAGLSGDIKEEVSGVITLTDPYTGQTFTEDISESDETDISFGNDGDLRLVDYSWNVGAGFIHEKGFALRILYSLGLRNLAPPEVDGSFKNDCITISAGWLFQLTSKKKE